MGNTTNRGQVCTIIAEIFVDCVDRTAFGYGDCVTRALQAACITQVTLFTNFVSHCTFLLSLGGSVCIAYMGKYKEKCPLVENNWQIRAG